MDSPFPLLKSGDPLIDRAFRIALGDLHSNTLPYQDGLLTEPRPCLLAGLDYDTPWTRDAAFNTWYAGALVFPEVAKNTLTSVLTREADGTVRIGGQYWDAIIWAQGAWQYYLCTGDAEFLQLAHEATANSLVFFEQTEGDPKDGLFRGGACFQDGIAGYPDAYAPRADTKSYGGIMSFVEFAGDQRAPVGEGIPCKALSTNCLYYRAYRVAGLMAEALKIAPDPSWEKKAQRMHDSINTRFWDKKRQSYRYFVDVPGDDDRQEGLGLAFALLFGLADNERAAKVFETVHLSPHGIQCVHPNYERYEKRGEWGRHSGPIWPQVSAAWAMACTARGRADLALKEIQLLTAKAVRDSEFIEVFHPETGLPYGGIQEDWRGPGFEMFPALHRQSWCASGYVGMIIYCLFGLKIDDRTGERQVNRMRGYEEAELSGLAFRGKSALL